jgi:hypothetical protein
VWRGEFNRVVLVVQLGLIVYFYSSNFYSCDLLEFFHFILNPEQRRVFQLVSNVIQTCDEVARENELAFPLSQAIKRASAL